MDSGKRILRNTHRTGIGLGKGAVLTLVTVCYLVSLRFASAIPWHRLLFLFYFLNLVIVPGYLLSRILYTGKHVLFSAILSFLSGTVLLYLILTLFAILRWNIVFAGIAVPCISLILTVLSVAGYIGPKTAGGRLLVTLPTARHAHGIVVAALLLVATVLVLRTGDPLLYTGDSQDHIAYIRTISGSHEAFPQQFLYKDGGLLTRDLRKGLLHAMWGTINTMTGRLNSNSVWPLTALIGSLCIILSLFCAGTMLSRNAAIGMLAAVLFVVSYRGGFRGLQLITIARSFPFGKVFLVMFLASAVLFFESRQRGYLVLVVLSAIAATGTHINHFLIIVFLTAVLSLAALFRFGRLGRRREVIVAIALLATAAVLPNLPYLLLRYLRDYAPNNIIHTHAQGLFSFTEKLIVVNPVYFLKVAGPLFVVAFISIFVLWKRSKDDGPLRMLFWGFIAICVLVFNPILVPLIMERISYLLYRFEFAVPSVLVTAYLIHELWRTGLPTKENPLRGKAVVGWITIALLVLYPLLKTPANFAYGKQAADWSGRLSCTGLNDLYEAINADVPRESVIASDPVTSYCIPAFTDQFVVCTYDQHSIPNDSTALDRILDCRELYAPGSGVASIARMLEKYGAGYVVLNGRIPPPVTPSYWKPTKVLAERAATMYMNEPGSFRLLYHHDGLYLFGFTGVQPTDHLAAAPLVDSAVGRMISPDEALRLPGSGEPGIRIAGVHVSNGHVRRGDTLGISIDWVALQHCEPKSYTTYLRFDTDFEKGRWYRASYAKPYRKLVEFLRGQRFRFRTEHLPLEGIYPPDRWPPRTVIRDHVTVRVPRDIAPGRYSISVKLTTKTHTPNYTINDLFSDADMYSGAVMGTVLIE
ncbi:MAG: hypothetical protein JSV33_14385 [bacterium]|nr:MAG: hypothetical protein JSV33_14385 [bacterium]